MDSDDVLCTTIYYYIREKFYGTALTYCEDGCRRFNDNHEYICLKCFCYTKLGKSADAIRLLTSLRKNSPVVLGVLTTLKSAYLAETNIDRDSVRELDNEINSLWTTADAKSCYVASLILFFDESYDKARSLLDKHLSSNSSDARILSLRGWLDVVTSRDIKAAQKMFDSAILTSKWPDAYFGQAQIFKERHNIVELSKTLSNLLDEYNTHIPAYIETIKSAFTTKSFEKVTEVVQSASLIQASDCIPIQFLEAAMAIVIQGETINIEQLLTELYESVSTIEKQNHLMLFRFAHFLASVAFDNSMIRQYSRKFLDDALACDKKVEYIAEKSRLLLIEGDVKGALQLAKTAVEKNVESKPDILFAIIRCYITMGDYKDSRSQLEFLKATYPDIDKSVLFYFYDALVKRTEGGFTENFVNSIRNAVDSHFSVLQRIPYGIEYIEKLNPAFLIEIVSRLFEVAPLAPAKTHDALLKEIIRITTSVVDSCPGLGRPCYLLAKARHIEGDYVEAEKWLKHCISRSSPVAEAYLLMAQIYLQRHQLSDASRCLDAGLGFSFQVREHPLYFLTKARMIKQEKPKAMEEAVTLLNTSLDLPVFKDPKLARQMDINEADRIAIYLEIIDCYQIMGRSHDADVIMKEALGRYSGTPEEDKLVLMNAQLRIQRGDIKGALNILQSVGPDESNFQAARIKMAQIYLEEHRDKNRFANCYRDIINADSSPQSYVLAGDAYMSIQEPTKAIEAYETAMRRNPKDFALAEKIGNAYVKCHLYHKAITFYEAAMKTSNKSIMRLRYAEELFRIKNYEKCERILMDVVDTKHDILNDKNLSVETIRDHVGFWMLLSKLHLESGNFEESMKDLMKAKLLQSKMLSKPASEVGDTAAEKKLASTICVKLAELHRNRRDYLKSVDFYKEAIEIDAKDMKSMLALAQLYHSMGKVQQCNQQCLSILNTDRNNNEATLANQYHAMARCIELHWRKGDLEAADALLKKALEANPRANVDAGFNYCKGLLEWYTCDPNSALNYFNRARRDLEWGERAVYNIIEIFLNPDYETLGGEALENTLESSMNDANQAERELNVKSAERFLNEIRSKPDLNYKFILMENFILLATSNKFKVQQALNNFLELIPNEESNENERLLNVGAILGASRAYLMLRQTQKAKTQLKRLISYQWSLEDADYLERCWLLLADLYINQGKSDQATAVLRTVLQYNASSIKAFEYMGFLKERQQEFNDAAANYECAWRLGKHRNPGVGFKLAYNYLKCRKYFECIEVCLDILQSHPDYPKIKKEILDKARAALQC